MIAADTNVWARALLNDERVQSRKARSVLAEARSAEGVFVPLIVFAELAWVLRGRWEREKVLLVLDGLLRARGVTLESPDVARKALDAARAGAAGIAGHWIAEIAFGAGAKEILTFDKAFGKRSGVRRIS